MSADAGRDQQLQDLLLRWEECRRWGETVTVQMLCRDHPALAEDLRRHVEALRDWDRLEPANLSSAGPGEDGEQAVVPTSVLISLRFHDLRFHDRGGPV